MAKKAKADRGILDRAMRRLKSCVDSDAHNRTAAIEDLRFANGEQWDAGEKKRRSDKGRPALQVNLLPKFIDQVVGDMLHNSPSVKVRPVDSNADVNVAKIRQGIISNIEYLSNSKAVYGYGARQMVTSGYGAWRVLTRYTDDNPFLQEIYLESLRNPFLAYMDPSSKDQNYADAKYGFVLEKMTREDFSERWPDAVVPTGSLKEGQGLGSELWYSDDTVTVAEYFSVESERKTLLQLSDGRVVDEEEFGELKSEWEEKNAALTALLAQSAPASFQAPPHVMSQMGSAPGVGSPSGGAVPGGAPSATGASSTPFVGGAPPSMPSPGGPPPPSTAPGAGPPAVPPAPAPDPLLGRAQGVGKRPEVVKRREHDVPVVRHRTITCCEILDGGVEGKRVPGRFIPVVIVKGKELNIEGKNYVYSLIRHAKDTQKLVNFWNTSAAETIALAPKAPWLGTAKQFEGYENDYAAANVENFPYLKYNVDPEVPGPPQRQSPAPPPAAIFEQIRRGEENLKSVIGMFNADVGAPGSEQTGAAITARQRPGDIGTFEFMENLSRAVLFTGRIINDMIPEVYDSERDVRLRHLDETESFVPVNTTVGGALDSVRKRPEMFAGMDVDKLRKMASSEGRDARFNDLTVGKYDVVVTTGPSYATQRQESAQHLLQLVQYLPQQMAIAADLIVQNMDFKDADELSARLRKGLPPGMAKPKIGEPPSPPPPPNPAMVAAQARMASEQAKVQMAQMKLEQEKLKLELEKLKLMAEVEKARLAASQPPVDPESAERLRLERERLDLEKARFVHNSRHDSDKLHHERKKAEESFIANVSRGG